MKILITGGCGFVGSNLAIYLQKNLNKSKIFSLDNLSRQGSRLNFLRLKKNNIKNFKINIENYNKIKLLPKFDLIIDCCAEAAVEASRRELDKVINTNLIGTFNILKKCSKENCDIIFLSSSRVYSIENLKKISGTKTISETFEVEKPKSIYGFSKYSSELLIKEFSYLFNIKYIINRLGVISGPWQFGKQDQGFVSLWVWRHFKKGKLFYKGFGGKGNQKRDVLHIDDVCKLIILQIKKIRKINNITINAGGGRNNTISLKQLTQICEKLTSNKIKISSRKTTSNYDIPAYITNNSKVEKIYKWKPSKNILKITNDIYIWMKKYEQTVRKYIK